MFINGGTMENKLNDLLELNEYRQKLIKHKISQKRLLTLFLIISFISIGCLSTLLTNQLVIDTIARFIISPIISFSITAAGIMAAPIIIGKENTAEIIENIKDIYKSNYKKELLSLKVENSFIRKSIKKLESETAMQKYSEESEQYSSRVQNELKYLRQVRSILIDFQNNYNRSYNFDDKEIAEQVSKEIQKVKRR